MHVCIRVGTLHPLEKWKIPCKKEQKIPKKTSRHVLQLFAIEGKAVILAS
jgi:hypothetical protein